MYSKEYSEELNNYSKKKILNFEEGSTLTKKEHKLIVDNANSKDLKNVYSELDDLTIADLRDFFAMERSNDRNN